MRIFAHYLSILNLLLRFSHSQPHEYLDRLWDALKSSEIEMYISQRGLDTIKREVESYRGTYVAGQVVGNLKRVFYVCPFVDLEEVRSFAHSHDSNSYEEALEVYSASLVSADIILSDFPNAFLSFRLDRFILDSKIDIESLKLAKLSTSLPLLLLGSFSDVWFLVNSNTVTTGLVTPNLSRWFRDNRFEPGWQPVEELLISYYKPAHRRKIVRRGKLVPLADSEYGHAENVALIISVANPSHQSNITVEVVSTNSQKRLPSSLKIQILDDSENFVEQENAMNKPAILMELEGEQAETFSVVIFYDGIVIHQEKFVI